MMTKISKFLDMYGRNLRWLGIYVAVVLLLFSLVLPLSVKRAGDEPAAIAPEPPLAPADPMPEISDEYVWEEQEGEFEAGVLPAKPAVTEEQALVQDSAPDIAAMVWPLRGVVVREVGLSYSQTFGDYRYHDGLDIQAARGTEVSAVLGGVVAFTETSKGEAAKVVIDHGEGWQSTYAHLEDVYVKKGAAVKTGQAIGHIGQPGLNEVLEGPHLHFSLKKDGLLVNPLDYLSE